MNHRRVIVLSATALLMAGPLVNSAHDSNTEAAGASARALAQDTDAPASGSTRADNPPMTRRTTGVLVLLAALAGLGGWFAYRRIRGSWDIDDDRLPPLLFPLEPKGSRRIAWEIAAAAGTAAAGADGKASHAGNGKAPDDPAPRGNAHGTTNIEAPARTPAAVFALADTEWGAPVQSGPIRFHRPPDGTLQLLPGRLEIVGGSAPEEIRFVKLTGREPVVTFGRSEGEPHAHIQLAAPTVSRMHASMRFLNGHWHIANLSETNPVVVNGRSIALNGAGQIQLADGDTVEMGQVVFRFRAR